jgi:hypothetical protein
MSWDFEHDPQFMWYQRDYRDFLLARSLSTRIHRHPHARTARAKRPKPGVSGRRGTRGTAQAPWADGSTRSLPPSWSLRQQERDERKKHRQEQKMENNGDGQVEGDDDRTKAKKKQFEIWKGYRRHNTFWGTNTPKIPQELLWTQPHFISITIPSLLFFLISFFFFILCLLIDLLRRPRGVTGGRRRAALDREHEQLPPQTFQSALKMIQRQGQWGKNKGGKNEMTIITTIRKKEVSIELGAQDNFFNSEKERTDDFLVVQSAIVVHAISKKRF